MENEEEKGSENTLENEIVLNKKQKNPSKFYELHKNLTVDH